MKRWLRGLGLTLLAAVLLLLVRQWHSQGRADAGLKEAMADLDARDPGWRLDEIEAARAVVPEESNSATFVVAVARLLGKSWPDDTLSEALSSVKPAEQLDGNTFDRLGKELDRQEPALEIARRLAYLPTGRHRLVLSRNPYATLLPDQQETRKVITLLTYEALRRNQEGDPKKALAACRAAFNSGRSLGDEPFAISQLIRLAGDRAASLAVERTLAQGTPRPEDLAGLQKLIEEEARYPGLLVAMRGERALLHAMFLAVERGEVRPSDLTGGSPNWDAQVADWYIRQGCRAEHTQMLALMTRRIEEVGLPIPEQAGAEKNFEAEVRTLPRLSLGRVLMPAVVKIGEAFRRNQAYLRCLAVALAAERYRQAHGNWPATLSQLQPDFLEAVPLDPFDGEPLRFRRLDDGVVVYSVGPDGKDDGGKLSPEQPLKPGTDLGVRLWDVPYRRQPPPVVTPK